MEKNETLLNKACEVITKFNQVEGPAVSDEVKNRFEISLSKNGFLEFGAFACPPINATLLTSENPEEYILTNPTGTSFEKGGKDQRINKLFKSLREVGIEVNLTVVMGDTDEEGYIFPINPPIRPLRQSLIELRRTEFTKNFTTYLAKKIPWSLVVERYTDIANLFDDLPPIPDLTTPDLKQDLLTEADQMCFFFSPGEYYEGLNKPSSSDILKMTELKFLTYAAQGNRLSRMYPNMVLIQNEFPLSLRTKMLNLSNSQFELPILPVIYPIPDRRGKK